ncbi:Shedu anti-phage system protein SduA domain-containing protein [Franzmannia pantelleriensis]|uniref:Shedu anti-phage system protein SduA domain-containing protein n=1 Tax=Franzmannia pantelleriensis TaxID=48727 RepID=UPI003BEF1016
MVVPSTLCVTGSSILRKPTSAVSSSNSKASVLLGRDNDFTSEQFFDFEIIRRKYANMLDIMTYEDLLRRLENIIFMMKTERH